MRVSARATMHNDSRTRVMNISRALVSHHLNEKMILTLSNGSELQLGFTFVGSSHLKAL